MGKVVFAPSVNYQDKFYTVAPGHVVPLGEAAALLG